MKRFIKTLSALVVSCSVFSSAFSAFSVYAAESTAWDFSDAAAVSATAEQSVDYNGLEVHLNSGDTITSSGILWSAPGTTTSDSTVVQNNRYIKYTPAKSGEISVTFRGDKKGSGKNYPRMYIVSGSDMSCMSKNNSDANGKQATASAIDTDTTLTATLTSGNTYYIWPYCYGGADVKFTVSAISFSGRDGDPVSSINVSYKCGDKTVARDTVELGEGYFAGDSYTYISNAYIKGTDGSIYAVGDDYSEDTDAKNLTGGANSVLKQTVTLNTSTEITYSVTRSDNIVLYDEWENLLGTSAGRCSNTDYIASGGIWTAVSKATSFYRITESGRYRITLTGGPKNRGTAIFATASAAQAASSAADGTQLINLSSGTNKDQYGVYSVKTVSLEAGDYLTIRGFNSNGYTDNLDYIVIKRVYNNEIIGADGISVVPGGATEQYSFDGDADNVEWSVAGVSGVSIDAGGLITVSENAGSGTARITATTAGGSYTKDVTIAAAMISDFRLSGSPVIEKGGEAVYKAVSVTDSFGNDITEYVKMSVISSDSSVISVDENGKARPVSDGTAEITVTATLGSSSMSKSVSVSSAVYSIIAEAEGDSMVIDTSELVKSENISGYLVTTATSGGVLVSQTEAGVSESVAVNTKNADLAEITPIFTYGSIEDVTGGYTLPDVIADGAYDVTVTKGQTTSADIYVNEYMLANDVDRAGVSRSKSAASTYTAPNVNITGGIITLYLKDCPSASTLTSAEFKKLPSIVKRKDKITILGGTFAAACYGDRTNKDLGSNQHGWGERLYRYIDTGKYDVVELAGSDMTVKAIYEQAISGAVQNSAEGDIILCECGYEDHLASTEAEMSVYMAKLSRAAEAAGIELIYLTTPVTFDEESGYSSSPAYSSAVRKAAPSGKLIDMSALSYTYVSSLYGTDFETAKSAYTANLGISDGVNFSFAGATKYAELVAKELRNTGAVTDFDLDFEYLTKDSKGNEIYASMNDDDNYITYMTYKDEDSVGVTVMPGSDGIVYAALYSADGRLISAKKTDGTEKAETIKFKRPSSDGCIIKLMNWDNSQTPLGAPSLPIEIDNIDAPVRDSMDNMEYGMGGIPYRYYLPRNYDSKKSYPVVMYLHGAGRRGSDNNDQLINGQYLVNTLLSERYLNNENTQCIIITPQCPSSGKWVNVPAWSTGSYNYDDIAAGDALAAAYDIITGFTEKYSVDTERIYIAGQSMGGYGTWRMAADHPGMFAAAVPLCGGGPKDEKGAGAIAAVNMPVWAFHGSSDGTVPVSASQEMTAALRAFGDTNVNYTELEGRNHEIQGEVFTTVAADTGLYEWLFAQKKSGASPIITPTPAATAQPAVTEAPTAIPTASPAPTTAPISYSWDFSEDQTAQSGSNVPLVSGAAVYDSTNKMVKLAAAKTEDNSVSVSLAPTLTGVVSIGFDMYIGQVNNTAINAAVSDPDGNEILKVAFNPYSNDGTVSIGGTEVYSGSLGNYYNKTAGDGINASVSRFEIEINTLKHTAELVMTKNESSKGVFTGSIAPDVNGVGAVRISRTSTNSNTDRHCYVDDLKISSYTPAVAFYATGAASITKRMGRSITEQYTVSKTCSDDTETVEWSVEGVEGIMIDSSTGVLTVPETAGVGTARVTATLTGSGTLPAGTADTIEVEINDFAALKAYDIGGATTIEVGGTAELSLTAVTDEDGNDITAFASLGGFSSSDPAVAVVDTGGRVTALDSGTSEITATLSIEKLGTAKTVTIPVKTGVYQLTSADKAIDVSKLISYGTDTYRIYSGNGYDTVTAENNIVTNTTGGAVTVVPVYKLNYRSSAAEGYTTATGAYSKSAGYGLVSGINYNVTDRGVKPLEGCPLKVDLPRGRYDIDIRRTGSRADIYVNGCQIVNNTSSGEQNRPTGESVFNVPEVLIENGDLDLTFGNISSGGGERIAELVIAYVPEEYSCPTIWIAGDSESANYFPRNTDGDDLESDKLMMTGFGMQLGYFMDDRYGISNMGQPSATSGTWHDECFESVLYQIKPGDIFLMDFGINEVSSKTNSMTIDEMKTLLKEMSDAVKAKGAQPVLLSPVYCGKYQAQSYFTYDTASGTNAASAFAAEADIPFIDLNKYLTLYINNAITETGDASWRQNNYQVTKDDLHITQYGALLAASFICAGLDELGYETTGYAYTYSDNSSVEDGYVRGGNTGVTRVYSIEKAKEFMQNN